jgi:trehalose 6-phosphate synthase complex regulatory subunit
MSSLKNHRVVIASLFLPNTVVLGESHPPTPDVRSELPLPDVFPGHAKDQEFKLSLPSPRNRTPGPILSIVDDLKDKASVGPLTSLRFCALNVTSWSGTPGPTLI